MKFLRKNFYSPPATISLGESEQGTIDLRIPWQLRDLVDRAQNAKLLFETTLRIDSLNESIALYQELWQHPVFVKGDTDLRSAMFYTGANAFMKRYEIDERRSDLDTSINAYRKAIQLSRNESAVLCDCYSNLSYALRERYRHDGSIADLADSIEAAQSAVKASRAGNQDPSTYLDGLGNALREFYHHGGDPKVLAAAIEAHTSAVQATNIDSPDYARYQTNLCSSLLARYQAEGGMGDLDRAINGLSMVANLLGSADARMPVLQSNLSYALLERYKATGSTRNLQDAVRAAETAVRLAEHESFARAGYLLNLSNALDARYEKYGDPADVERAMQVAEESVRLSPDRSPDRVLSLSRVAGAYYDLYLIRGDIAELNTSIDRQREVIALASARNDTLNLGTYLNNLGDSLRERFEKNGDASDLTEAIDIFERSVELEQVGTLRRARSLDNLGLCLKIRYEVTGLLRDLDKAIDLYREAIKLVPKESPAYATYLNDLGNALERRAGHRHDYNDLFAAVEAFDEVLLSVDEDSPDYVGYFSNWIRARRNLLEIDGTKQEAGRFIQFYKRMRDKFPVSSPDYAGFQHTLGNTYLDVYETSNASEDLEQAITHFETAIGSPMSDTPSSATYHENYAISLRKRHQRNGDLVDLENAVSMFRKACELGQRLDWSASLTAAKRWGYWALERCQWEEAVEALKYGVTASEHLFRTQPLRTDKEVWLTRAVGIQTNLAYAMARMNGVSIREVVEILEHGRSRLLSEILERRSLERELLDVLPTELANRYRASLKRLDELQDAELIDDSGMDAAYVQELMQVQSELNTIHEEIQDIRGSNEISDTLSFEEIQSVSVNQKSPLVYVAVGLVGTVLCFVAPEREPWILLNNELTIDTVYQKMTGYSIAEDSDHKFPFGIIREDQLHGYLGAYVKWRNNRNGPEEREQWLAAIEDMCGWLWDNLVHLIINELHSYEFDRVTIVPFGLLSLLPFHAARTNDSAVTKRFASSGASNVSDLEYIYASDLATFSYAPNARSIREFPSELAEGNGQNLLAIRASVHNLPYAGWEVAEACKYYAEDRHSVLLGDEVNPEDMASLLREYSILHFACHGRANGSQPLRGGIQLASGTFLSVGQVMAEEMQNTRLAILSACETGIVGTMLLDEVVSLQTAFVQAGVAGVVASLWAVADVSTALLISEFYRRFAGDSHISTGPMEALQAAQHFVRDSTARELDLEGHYRRLYIGSGRQDSKLLKKIHFYSRHPDIKPFTHPYFWAAFTFSGL